MGSDVAIAVELWAHEPNIEPLGASYNSNPTWPKERKEKMTIESNSDEVIANYSVSYYKELACEEEIYREKTEEELRSDLTSDMPQKDHP